MASTQKIALAALLSLGLAPAVFGQKTVLKEKYSLKVRQDRLSPAEFTLKINGEVIGTYDDNASVDLTDFIKAGRNNVIVNWKLTTKRPNSFGKTTLTIGVQRNGKWNTAANVTASKASPSGTKKMTLTAR